MKARSVSRTASLAGILFAGYFVAQELLRFRAGGFQSGTLVLPTCAYGLVFFTVIFAVSFMRTSDLPTVSAALNSAPLKPIR
jgi:hypothetical protein